MKLTESTHRYLIVVVVVVVVVVAVAAVVVVVVVDIFYLQHIISYTKYVIKKKH